jgi:Flp pilus assembly pilin Flp
MPHVGVDSGDGRPMIEVPPLHGRITLNDLMHQMTDESGQTMAEYAVVLGVIVIAVVVTLGLLSTKISSVLNGVTGSM